MNADERSRWWRLREQVRELLDAPAPEPSRDLFRPDALEKWAAGMPPQDEPEPEQKAAPAPVPVVDVAAEVAAAVEAAIENERAFNSELLSELVAEIQRAAADDLERATRMLTCELAELRATLAELRAVVATERIERTGQPLDLPRLPRGRDLN